MTGTKGLWLVGKSVDRTAPWIAVLCTVALHAVQMFVHSQAWLWLAYAVLVILALVNGPRHEGRTSWKVLWLLVALLSGAGAARLAFAWVVRVADAA